MTKLEELSAAYEAATPGEWEPLMTCGELHVCTPVNEGCDVGTVCIPYERSDATFIALAHNNIAALLEAVAALKAIRARYEGEFDNKALMDKGALLTDPCEDMYQFAIDALGKFK